MRDDRHDHGAERATIGSVAELNALASRRGFMRLMGLGGALVLLPGLATACGDSTVTGLGAPGSGSSVVIDFAAGDVAVLQLAYVLELIEADFYNRVVAAFTGSNFTAAEQVLLTDIRNHEVIHRELLKSLLSANASFSIKPTFGSLNFGDRAVVLPAAKKLEELGVAAYNGVAQYLTSADTLAILAKIVSVEARHASAIADLVNPRTSDFAPATFDAAFSTITTATTAQG